MVSKDRNLKGYLNKRQVAESLECHKFTTKIGSVVHQRINWFSNLSQPPTAYTSIVLIEERIQLIDSQKHYALLSLNGMSRNQIGRLIFTRSFYVGIAGILVAIPLTLFALKFAFENILEVKEYFQWEWVLELTGGIFVLFLCSMLLSIKYLKRRNINELLNENSLLYSFSNYRFCKRKHMNPNHLPKVIRRANGLWNMCFYAFLF